MTLYHYTAEPFHLDPQRTFEQSPNHTKPYGLWVSVDDDWQRWCQSEDFGTDRLVHRTKIEIASDADILTLKTPEALDAFTSTYQTQGPKYASMIDWQRVARVFQGIIIAPYQWERRLAPHTFWYYGWDCASGCIWDSSVIQVVGNNPPHPVLS